MLTLEGIPICAHISCVLCMKFIQQFLRVTKIIEIFIKISPVSLHVYLYADGTVHTRMNYSFDGITTYLFIYFLLYTFMNIPYVSSYWYLYLIFLIFATNNVPASISNAAIKNNVPYPAATPHPSRT